MDVVFFCVFINEVINMKYLVKLKEKKIYLLIGAAILLVGIFLAVKLLRPPVDNAALFSEKSSVTKSNVNGGKDATTKKEAGQSNENSRITVDIFGSVRHEGVYQLAAESRLNDLLELAGGVDDKADLKAINRAMVLTDGIKVYVPYKGENAPSVGISNGNVATTGTTGTGETGTDKAKININSATVTELQELNGIGEKKAEQILAYREENGPFMDAKDLTNVSGIGDKTYENLADQVTI